MKELELIQSYFYFCDYYVTDLHWYCQRFSPNSLSSNEKLTDTELLTLTLYFYARRYENKHGKKEIQDYANRYLKYWFSNLPAYAHFNHRMNPLAGAINVLAALMRDELQVLEYQAISDISWMDSLPLILCSGKRRGKVAPELSDKSYCATKNLYYYGVKLHTVAFFRKNIAFTRIYEYNACFQQ